MDDFSTLPSLYEIDKILAEKSLYDFVKLGWKSVEPGNAYNDGWHIKAICEHLEAVTNLEIRNLIINVPPRNMKSLLVCVFWFCWTWIRSPESRWMFSSYSDALATRDSLKCRRLILSPWYQSLWGDIYSLLDDQNQKTKFENTHLGYRLSSGIGGMATGEGGDYIVVDDPLKERDSHSDVRRKFVNDWWDNTMSTRGNNPMTVRKVIIMQRLHQEDLVGHVLDSMRSGGEQYEYLRLPAEYELTSHVTKIGWKDPRTTWGQPLWPQRYPSPKLAVLKNTMSAYAVASQLQQRPSPDVGGIFKKRFWRYWTIPGIELPEVTVEGASGLIRAEQMILPTDFDEIIQSWDTAFKSSDTNDFVCGIVIARKGLDRFVLDMVNERMDISETMLTIEQVSKRWTQAHLKLIEDKANGPAVIRLLRNTLDGLYPIEPEGGKIARANAVAPTVSSGHVYLPHPVLARWTDSFIESCAGFPNLAHDDDVDAFTQALNYWNSNIPLIGVG